MKHRVVQDDRLRRFLSRGEFDECETAEPVGILIAHEDDVGDFAELREAFLKHALAHGAAIVEFEGKIAAV